MSLSPRVSVIIVNYRGEEYTRQCIRSIQSTSIATPYEIIVVDNNSNDGSVEHLRSSFPNSTILSLPENRGFGAANNIGAQHAKGEFLFFLNNDTKIVQDCFTPVINYFSEQTDAGIVAPKLLYPDGSFQLSYGEYPTLFTEFRTKQLQKREPYITPPSSPQKMEWVTGAAFCMRKELFLQLQGFDEKFFMYFEDADLCKRVMEAGYAIYYLPDVALIHFKGKSSTTAQNNIPLEYRRSQLRYYRKHASGLSVVLLKIYLSLKYANLLMRRKELRMILFES